jgi:hypothetical protein
MQVTRVDAYNLTTSLPPRLRKAYAQQFTPRVGRLVVHHPSHHHGSGTGSWKGLTELKVGSCSCSLQTQEALIHPEKYGYPEP